MTSLWGPIPATVEVKPPVAILGEQANEITAQTRGVIRGHVDKTARDGRLYYELSLNAPALDNYYIAILTIVNGIDLYPATIRDHIHDRELQCGDEGQLIDSLGQVLGSPEVSRIVASLLSQSKAA